jgi:DNA-binding LacI/PurR family transcriptional regulator
MNTPADGATTSASRPTLADVAAAAGVSLSTASLAFSGNKPVSAATRERIVAAAERLGYTGPHPLARSLRHGRSGVVGVVVSDLTSAFRDPAMLPFLEGISEVLDAADLGMLLLAGAQPRALGCVSLDGVIYDPCGRDGWAEESDLDLRGIPMVSVESPDVPAQAHLDIAHRRGMADLARRLAELGHRRVATVTLGPSHPARERLEGVREVFPEAVEVSAGDGDLEQARTAVAPLLALPPDHRPTAVLAQSDLLAAGVVREALARGLRVPEELSITGFDGVPTPWLELELTTVAQPLREKGERAATMLLALIAGETPADHELPVEVREGASIAPAPGRRDKDGQRASGASPGRTPREPGGIASSHD